MNSTKEQQKALEQRSSSSFNGIEYVHRCLICDYLIKEENIDDHIYEHVQQLCQSYYEQEQQEAQYQLCEHEIYEIGNSFYLTYKLAIVQKFIKSYMIIDPTIIQNVNPYKNVFLKDNYNYSFKNENKIEFNQRQCGFQNSEQCLNNTFENLDKYNGQQSHLVSFLIKYLVQKQTGDNNWLSSQ